MTRSPLRDTSGAAQPTAGDVLAQFTSELRVQEDACAAHRQVAATEARAAAEWLDHRPEFVRYQLLHASQACNLQARS
jgi:hypothetical protein